MKTSSFGDWQFSLLILKLLGSKSGCFSLQALHKGRQHWFKQYFHFCQQVFIGVFILLIQFLFPGCRAAHNKCIAASGAGRWLLRLPFFIRLWLGLEVSNVAFSFYLQLIKKTGQRLPEGSFSIAPPAATPVRYMPFMRPFILVTIFISLTFQTFSQNEMDTRCMKRIKEFSADIHFPKFTGLTVVSKDTLKFDSSIIIIRSTDTEIIKIFELGLVFPDLIYGASTMGDKYEFKRTFSADTLSISNVTELHFPNQRQDTKSFSFLLWQQNMANPSLYLFELTNKTAKPNMTIRTFVEKAKISAFGFCSILI